MGKRFGSTIRIIAALFLSLLATNFMPTMSAYAASNNPNGNNGTLKVHESGTPSGTESNDPKVCEFNFEGFSFDAAQSGYIVIAGQGQTNGSYGNYSFGPTDNAGYAATEYFNDANGPTIPNGQYKATLYGKDTGGNIDLSDEKAKSKVFKIECAAPDVEVTPAAPTQNDVCGKADYYTIPSTTGVVYKVDGTAVSAGTYTTYSSVTITAKSAGSPYVLAGDTSWTFHYTNHKCDKVKVAVQDECVDRGSHDGKFSVEVTNKSDESVYYVVLIDNGAKGSDYTLVAAHDSYTFKFKGYHAGTFDVKVIKVTSNTPGQIYIPNHFVKNMLAHTPMPWLNFKTVYRDCVTLDECPCDDDSDDDDNNQPPVDVCPNVIGIQTNAADCQTGGNPTTPPGHVLGDSTIPPTTGHILATSTTVPNVLPNTGAPATNPWLTIIAAAIAFLAVRAITRKKLITGQI